MRDLTKDELTTISGGVDWLALEDGVDMAGLTGLEGLGAVTCAGLAPETGGGSLVGTALCGTAAVGSAYVAYNDFKRAF